MKINFSEHKRLLATDDAYRRRFGLSPLNGSENVRIIVDDSRALLPSEIDEMRREREGAKALADIALIAPPDPMVTAANAAVEQAYALLTAREQRPALTSNQIDAELFTRVDQLNVLRRELDRLSKALKVAADEDEEVLVDMYLQAGTGLFEQGGRVGTLANKLWARKVGEDVTGQDVAAALRADGLEHLVTPESYHNGQLSAYLRRLDEDGQPIPPHLAEVIEAYETKGIGYTTRRATRAQRRRDGAPSSVLDGASKD